MSKDSRSFCDANTLLSNSSFSDINQDVHNSTMRNRNKHYLQDKSNETIDNIPTLSHQKSINILQETERDKVMEQYCTNPKNSKPTELSVCTYKKGCIRQKNIYIFGGKQCTNLATQLIGHRQTVNTTSENYKISSYVKPNACTEHITNTLKTYTFAEEDILILSLGEHDHDPTKLMIEVSTVLNSMEKNRVYILSVPNIYLNEKRLNGRLKLICNYFDNCSFIDLHDGKQYHTANVGHNCTRINMIIDQHDYNNKFTSL